MNFLSWFGNTALITYEGHPKQIVTYEELGIEKGPARFCILLQRRCFPAKELNAFLNLAEAQGLPEALTWFHAILGLLIPEEARLRRNRVKALQGMRYPKWAEEKYGLHAGRKKREAPPPKEAEAGPQPQCANCGARGGWWFHHGVCQRCGAGGQ